MDLMEIRIDGANWIWLRKESGGRWAFVSIMNHQFP